MKKTPLGVVMGIALTGFANEVPVVMQSGTDGSPAANCVAAEPKVGCSVAFSPSYYYTSNDFLRDRPIAREMIASGIDFCLYNGPTQKVPTAEQFLSSLKQFNCVWLMLEHEIQCPFDAPLVGAALRAYVEAGGGLVINHSPGRYPEAAVDGYWDTVFASLDMHRLHEEVADLAGATNAGTRALFHTANVMPHPVTENVAGLWLVQGTERASTWGVHAIVYSADWATVIATEATAKSYYKDPNTNVVDLDRVGTYAQGPVPVVAVRTLGKGRIVSIAEHKDVCGWAYNLDTWPNLTERSTWGGKPSDNVTLLANAFRWAGTPSMSDGTFTRDYVPVEPVIPPYVKDSDVAPLSPSKWVELGTSGAVRKQYAAVVGAHSDFSDGTSSVAEYATEAKRLGISAVVFTDPLELLGSEAKLDALRAACAAASDGEVYCCPGVEYVDGSDIRWILAHDRVTFPPDSATFEGRVCPVWNGSKVMSRNYYGGHQNLFRGAVIDYSRVRATGNVAMNLAYFSGVIPKAYEDGVVVADNVRDLLRTSENLHRAAPMGYTRLTSATNLVRALAASAMYADSPSAFSEIFNSAGGWGTNDKANGHQAWVRCGGDAVINRFATARVPGTQLQKVTFDVLSASGLAEVRVCDGVSRIVARFACDGATRFSREFSMTYDRQGALQLVVTDVAGGTAYSSMLWLQQYYGGLFRCGDNSNLMSQNPELTYFSNWNDSWCPFEKAFASKSQRHYHISESFLWDASFYRPTQLPVAGLSSQWGVVSIRSSPVGSAERVSNFTTYPLTIPRVVTIVDQVQGEALMEKSGVGSRHTYANGSLDRVTRATASPFVHRRRVHHFIERIDKWWYKVYGQLMPDYRGGFNLVEGEIIFTNAVDLLEPITLARFTASHPSNGVPLYASQSAAGGQVRLGAGDYAAFCPSDDRYYAFFGLEGSDKSLRLGYGGATNAVQGRLYLSARGTVAAGTTYRYRFAVATLNESPRGGAFLADIARKLDGTGIAANARIGRVDGCSGILDATAQDGVCALALSADDFIEDFPVRISGLEDNGSAWQLDADGRPVRALAFCDGKAYAKVRLEDGALWRFQNLFRAADSRLSFTYLPGMLNHTSPEVEIANPTDEVVSCAVTNLMSGAVFTVSVPPAGRMKKVVDGSSMEVTWQNAAGDGRLDNSANWGGVYPDGTPYTTCHASATTLARPLVMTAATSLSPDRIKVTEASVFDLGRDRSYLAQHRASFAANGRALKILSGTFGVAWDPARADHAGEAAEYRQGGEVAVCGNDAALSFSDANLYIGYERAEGGSSLTVSGGRFSVRNRTKSARSHFHLGHYGCCNTLCFTDGAYAEVTNVDYFCVGNTATSVSNRLVVSNGARLRVLSPNPKHNTYIGNAGPWNGLLVDNAVVEMPMDILRLGGGSEAASNNWMRLVNHATVDVYRVICGEYSAHEKIEVDDSTLIARTGQIQLGGNTVASRGHLLDICGRDARVESLCDPVSLAPDSEMRFTVGEDGFANSPVVYTPRGLVGTRYLTASNRARIRIEISPKHRQAGSYTLVRSTYKTIDLTNVDLVYDSARVNVSTTPTELAIDVLPVPEHGLILFVK